jgi:predicted permease
MAYLAQSMSNSDFLPEGETYDPHKRNAEDYNVVGQSFFQTLSIPIVAGRSFGPQDTATSPKVAIINRALAKKRFPNQNPIGKVFRTGDGSKGEPIQIVGICADTYYYTLRDEPPAQFFVPYVQQNSVGGMTYQLRTALDPATLAPLLRRTVQSVDRDLPVSDLRTQRQQIDATLQVERTLAALTSGFGLLALALACVGIYGVMAYTVAQRTNEIVRRMILGESARLTVVGIVVGAAGAVALARLVKSMLYGIAPYDAATLAGGVALLLAVALGASWIPARRAAGIEPMQALRHE